MTQPHSLLSPPAHPTFPWQVPEESSCLEVTAQLRSSGTGCAGTAKASTQGLAQPINPIFPRLHTQSSAAVNQNRLGAKLPRGVNKWLFVQNALGAWNTDPGVSWEGARGAHTEGQLQGDSVRENPGGSIRSVTLQGTCTEPASSAQGLLRGPVLLSPWPPGSSPPL